MPTTSFSKNIRAALVELPCQELDPTVQFFTERLGMRIDAIFPADNPAIAELSGHGLSVRLVRGSDASVGRLQIHCDTEDPIDRIIAPNGTEIEFVALGGALTIPPVKQSVIFTQLNTGDEREAWQTGRAGMLYRDLIPDRQGGRYIASHIRIPDGGPVPDYVHFHKIRFQMIYCYRGWVRLVYEDQGEPFVMKAGDCVLQPPLIRHRVLESSAGLEVIEIGCPANHETLADHDLSLPTGQINPGRDFGGQTFAFHQAEEATWQTWRSPGFEMRDFGLGRATQGIGQARVIRVAHPSITCEPEDMRHHADLCLFFILTGSASMELEQHPSRAMSAGDCCVLPSAMNHRLTQVSADLTLLEVLA